MKKSLILAALILTFAAFAAGCSFGNNKPAGDPPAEPQETRYTVTAEEWAALAGELNYTVETEYNGEEPYIQKYTKDAAEIGGDIVLFIDDKQYRLSEENGVWIAGDVTFVDFWHGGLLSNVNYEDFFYDESLCAYVNVDYEEEGSKLIIKFENGLPVSSTSFILGEDAPVAKNSYTNVGATVIEIPEYIFDYERAPDPAKLVTEEEWNKFINEKNFAADVMMLIGEDYSEGVIKSIENAMQIGDTVLVFDADKWYALEQIDGAWYAKEYSGVVLPGYLLPEGLDYNDFEYDVQNEVYVQKNTDGAEYIYTVGFYGGLITSVQIEKAYDPERPDYMEVVLYAVSEIGTVTIDIPEYVIAK